MSVWFSQKAVLRGTACVAAPARHEFAKCKFSLKNISTYLLRHRFRHGGFDGSGAVALRETDNHNAWASCLTGSACIRCESSAAQHQQQQATIHLPAELQSDLEEYVWSAPGTLFADMHKMLTACCYCFICCFTEQASLDKRAAGGVVRSMLLAGQCCTAPGNRQAS